MRCRKDETMKKTMNAGRGFTKKLRLRLEEMRIVLCCLIGRALAVFASHRHWVLVERGDDARDNAYFLYQFIKKQHPEQKVYYFIKKTSADFPKVREDAVEPGSLKSCFLLVSASKIVSTHYASGLPFRSAKFFRMLGLHKKFYFLQHGITHNDLPGLYAKNAPMRMFVCGAKPEYEFVKANFGHPGEVVQYTGFARFDNLHDVSVKRQILVMPTWRMYIRSEKDFLSSDYFRCWQSFLNHPALKEKLEKEDLRLIFYVHYGMQPYAGHFVSPSERMVIARFQDYDVQTLLKESAVLVTDYSSVHFDFAYMRKPVLYYQFDEEVFGKKHYMKGYLDYREMGFGNVCTQEADAVSELTGMIDRNCRPEERFTERINSFFPLFDTGNCKRIYEFIKGDR